MAAAGWGETERALDQSDIDNLFGDAAVESDVGQKRRGFEALITNVVSGIDRMPMLNIMIDRLAQAMTVSMRGFTGDNADVSIDRLNACRLKDFIDAVSLPAMIAILRVDPWEGYCLAALDPRLITTAMDVLLGGRRNREVPIEGRPYTAIERAFIERLTNEVIATDLKQAFEIIGDCDFVLERLETTPSYAAVTKQSAAAISFRAEVAMGQRGGHIDFLIPYSTFDPVREQLLQEFAGKKHGGDPAWRSHLSTVLPYAEVGLQAVIEERPISTTEVMSWKPGSRLLLERRQDEQIDVFCNELLVLRAAMAEKEGRLALHVSECRFAKDWPV
ncbi:MAG: FliM/FliN family flagellar motor switch protein [Alphaproteobacteria bacterium]|nr:FliM/FliN family flagellar motor switch protein [Alphaproteobacteria bacterium]